MSIVKNTPHILKHSGLSFTTLINNTLDCIKDPGTLGVYVYLASKPSDWEISESNLQNRFSKGRDYIRARMAELKLLGLLKSMAIKDKKGRIVRWETVLFNEVQITENPSCGVHITEKPPSGKSSHLGNPPTTNKGSLQIKEPNKPPISPRGLDRFDEFWDMYPIKEAKKVCVKYWQTRNLDLIADKIIDKLYQQVNYDDKWLRGFAPNPTTYINQERWNDEIKKPSTAIALTSKSQCEYDDIDQSWVDEVSL